MRKGCREGCREGYREGSREEIETVICVGRGDVDTVPEEPSPEVVVIKTITTSDTVPMKVSDILRSFQLIQHFWNRKPDGAFKIVDRKPENL